jgi:hypothetical protein
MYRAERARVVLRARAYYIYTTVYLYDTVPIPIPWYPGDDGCNGFVITENLKFSPTLR